MTNITIRLGYVIRCSTSTIKIQSIMINYPAGGPNTVDLEVKAVSDRNARVAVKIDEVDVNGVPLKVRNINVSATIGTVRYTFPLNLGIVENSTTANPFVYVGIGSPEKGNRGLECREYLDLGSSSLSIVIRIDKVMIYPLESVRVPRFRVVHEHETPFSAQVTVEYTIVNNAPFHLRFVYLYLGRFVKGLVIRDEGDKTLRFLTMQELREVFGEDIINRLKEFYLVVDLGEELGPGKSKVLRLVGTEGVETRRGDYVLAFGLSPGVTEGVVIKPPQGYDVVIDRSDILVVRDISNLTKNSLGNRQQAQSLFATQTRQNRFRVNPNLWLDAFLNLNVAESSNRENFSSSAIVDLQFRLYHASSGQGAPQPLFTQPVENPGIVIRYFLEIQHRQFWHAFLTFFSMLVFALFFQELFYDVIITVGHFYSSFVQSYLFHNLAEFLLLAFVMGSLSGFFYAIHYGLVRKGESLWEILLIAAVYSVSVVILSVYATFSFSQIIPVKTITTGIGDIYLELEFATLVAIELAYFLAERAVRDDYRSVLLVLTVLTLASMLLLVPWLV